MAKHVKAITYQPKIEPVLDGRCTQTIRTGRNVSAGDEILFHGWSGKPYRSKWDWRKRVEVKVIIPLLISSYGFRRPDSSWIRWGCNTANELAALDFIDPPTGEALRDVLFSLNCAPKEPAEYQIIRW